MYIPPEIVQYICIYLDIKHIQKLYILSNEYYSILNDKIFWKILLREHFKYKEKENDCYKKYFQLYYKKYKREIYSLPINVLNDKVNWYILSKTIKMSSSCIELFYNKWNWNAMSMNKNLTKEIIFKYKHKLNGRYLIERNNCDDEIKIYCKQLYEFYKSIHIKKHSSCYTWLWNDEDCCRRCINENIITNDIFSKKTEIDFNKFLNEKQMESKLYKVFTELNIKYNTFYHPVVTTVEEALKYNIPGIKCKNLLLNDKNNDHFLIVAGVDTKIQINSFNKLLNKQKMSMSKEIPESYGVEKGGLTPFLIINDSNIELLIDNNIKNNDLAFHPLRNDATTIISYLDLILLLDNYKVKYTFF